MSQSLTPKNFSDIVLDPTTIAVVGSIAIHAIFAANLAFFTQPSKELKKPEPGTVKVVELTPNELQRIPQAPTPATIPTPSQQVLPPVYQPSTPAPPVNQPINPPIATAPNTIPLSPTKKVAAKSPVIRIPTKQKVATKSPQGKKDQKATPQAQPEPPTFDPDSFKPTPDLTPAPDTPEPSPKPTPTPTQQKKKQTSTKKTVKTQKEPNGGQLGERKPSKPSAPGEEGVDIPVPTPGTKTAAGTPKVPTSPSPQPTEKSPGDENGLGTYGKYTGKASERLQEYQKSYPGILERSGKPRALTIPYPVGTVCPKSPQKPFIVLMVVLGKITAQDPTLGGETTGETNAKQFVAYDKDTPENKKLGEIAVAKALEAANTADQNREQKNKDKEFLYQYRVTFDPKSCKNN